MNISKDSVYFNSSGSKITLLNDDIVTETAGLYYLQSDSSLIKLLYKIGSKNSYELGFNLPLAEDNEKTCSSCNNELLKGYFLKNSSGTFMYNNTKSIIHTFNNTSNNKTKKINVYYCSCNDHLIFRDISYNI